MSENKLNDDTHRDHNSAILLNKSVDKEDNQKEIKFYEEELNPDLINKKIQTRVFSLLGERYKINRIKKYSKRLWVYDTVILVSTLLSALIAVISTERNLFFTNIDDLKAIELNFYSNFTSIDKNNSKMNKTQLEDYEEHFIYITRCRYLVSSFTLVIIICTIIHYYLRLGLEKIKMNLKPEDTMYSSGFLKYMILELILNIFHTPPYVDGNIELSQRDESKGNQKVNIDNILTIALLFFRSYHLVKYFALHSKWNNYKNEKICHECKTALDFLFSIKAEFKNNPFILVGSIMLVSIFVFGYSVRSIEMFFMRGNSSPQDWRYFWNGMWCVIVTMSTVGFGDFYPISLLGRGLIVVAAFWGTFLISLMVAALSVSVEFNSQESISYESIKAARAEMDYGMLGILLIQKIFRYNKHVKMTREDPNLKNTKWFLQKKSKLFIEVKKVIHEFRIFRKKKYEQINSYLVEASLKRIDEYLTTQMDKIKQDLKIVGELKDLLLEYNNTQELIKKKTIELYREIEEVSIFKEKYLKNL